VNEINPTAVITTPSKRNRRPVAFVAAAAIGLVAMSAVLSTVPSVAQQARAQVPVSAPPSFADLAEKLLPAVVNISTSQTVRAERGAPGGQERRRSPDVPMPQFPPGSPFEEFFKDFFERGQRPDAPPRRSQSLGSGFIIDPAGFVVTNNHVIGEADEIKVILQDDTQLSAKLVGRDAKTDLALLKVEANRPLPAVKWGTSDKARVGEWVLAIGNPFGLGGSVTAGIISARKRDINAGPYDDFIQTDAPINRGNSGGPLFNLAGEIIGINTAIFSPSGGSIGIGFSIPSDLAKPVIDQLRQYGKTRRGWLGVNIQTVTDEIAESLGLDRARGALVARVSDKGPADVGKIQSGDVILKFDGQDITDMRRLPRVVADTQVDKTVKVVIWRKGKEQTLDVKVGELKEDDQVASAGSRTGPSGPAAPATLEALGMSLSPLTPELRERFDIAENARGVVVTKVTDNSAASERGVRPGDLIVEVAQEEVTSPAQVETKVADAKRQGRKTVLVMVERQGEQRFVALRVDPKG